MCRLAMGSNGNVSKGFAARCRLDSPPNCHVPIVVFFVADLRAGVRDVLHQRGSGESRRTTCVEKWNSHLASSSLAMCSGISVIIYRSRDRFLGAAEWSPEHDCELLAMVTHTKDIENLDPQERSPLSVGGNTLPKDNGSRATDNGRPQVQL